MTLNCGIIIRDCEEELTLALHRISLKCSNNFNHPLTTRFFSLFPLDLYYITWNNQIFCFRPQKLVLCHSSTFNSIKINFMANVTTMLPIKTLSTLLDIFFR